MQDNPPAKDRFPGTLPWCWMNGTLMRVEDGQVSIVDRGFLYGDGLFETLRLVEGRPFKWASHWQRFQQGCQALKLPLDPDPDAWLGRIQSLVETNQSPECMVRIQISRGLGPRGYGMPSEVQATQVITMHTAPTLSPSTPLSWTLTVASLKCPGSWALHGCKHSNRLFQILVKQEALTQGVDDAIVLNDQDHLTETSSANVFLIHEGCVKTPSLSSGILPGTTRRLLLDLCKELGIPQLETECPAEMLAEAESVFVSLSSYGLVHASQVQDRHFSLHPMESTLYQAFLRRLQSP